MPQLPRALQQRLRSLILAGLYTSFTSGTFRNSLRPFAALRAMEPMDPEKFVRNAMPGECRSVTFSNEQFMGFSGATVADVHIANMSQLLFLKIIEPAPLAETASDAERHKWTRNLQSYGNELAFFTDKNIQQALDENGVRIPKLWGSEAIPGTRYAILTENLKSEWSTFAVHPAVRTPEVLRWLGYFHAAFQGKVPENHDLWDFGTHVHLQRRPNGELDGLPRSISDFCDAFQDEDPFFQRSTSRALGHRLRHVASWVSEHLTPGPQNEKRLTLVHGDFKGANYFLKNEGEGCCAFDWQWTGPGIGATDLIYLFCGSVEDEIVRDYETWLKLYHSQLPSDQYTFDEFLFDFKVATLDYARWVFAYRLVGDTPEKFRKRAENVDVNLGFFRRHLPRIIWLLQLVEEFLPEVEARCD